MNAALFAADRADWQTPDPILDRMREAWGRIALDPCTSIENPTDAERWCVEPEAFERTKQNLGVGTSDLERDGMFADGLAQDWSALSDGGLVYANPPYGNAIRAWVEKARTSCAEVVMLLPARTDTRWFHDADPSHRCFLRGRLKFKGAPASAPFPSLLLYYGEDVFAFRDAFGDRGLFG